MHKLTYFIAAVYAGLKLRRFRRDPYISIVGTLVYGFVLLLLFIDSILTIINKHIIPESPGPAAGFILGIAILLAAAIRFLLPEKKLSKIEVDETVAKSYATKYLVGFTTITIGMVSLIGIIYQNCH